MNTDNLEQMLKRIIRDNGNYVSKMKAEECLVELQQIKNKNKLYRIIMGEINKTSKIAIESLEGTKNVKSNT